MTYQQIVFVLNLIDRINDEVVRLKHRTAANECTDEKELSLLAWRVNATLSAQLLTEYNEVFPGFPQWYHDE